MLPQSYEVGFQPSAIAVDEELNSVYVTNWSSGTMTRFVFGSNKQFDGDSAPDITTIETGYNPVAVMVDSSTNKVYVANGGGSVSIFNPSTNEHKTLRTGRYPCALAFDSSLQQIYVANQADDTVSIIDSQTDQLKTSVAVDHEPAALGVNSRTHYIYVANRQANSVSKIDFRTNATVSIPVGSYPGAIAIDENLNKIYVVNRNSNDVTVIDGATDQTQTIAVGAAPLAIAVNPGTSKVYVANSGDNTVSVIDGATGTTTNVALGVPANDIGEHSPAIEARRPFSVAIDSHLSKVYVANTLSHNVTVIDEAQNNRITIMQSTGYFPKFIAVNATTGDIFTTNSVYSWDKDGSKSQDSPAYHGGIMRSFPIIRTPR